MNAMRRIFMLALALAGLFVSLYLSWEYTSPSHPMLCLGTGCDFVRASRYAHFLGVPTPFYGVVFYVLLGLLIFSGSLSSGLMRRRLRAMVLPLASAGLLASAFLTGIEAFVLHHWCEWCLGSAAAASLIFLIAVIDALRAPVGLEPCRRGETLAQALVLIVAAALGTPLFIHLVHRGSFSAAPSLVHPGPAALARLIRPDSEALGSPRSRVTIVEFGDFECPMCALAQASIERALAQYGRNIRLVFRQFPLTSVHPQAEKAAEASLCAAAQGRFWRAERLFYRKQADLSVPALERYAAELQLMPGPFQACLASGNMSKVVQRDLADGRALGVRGTPTFFILRSRGNARPPAIQTIYGPPQYAVLSAMIQQALTRPVQAVAGPPLANLRARPSGNSHPAAAVSPAAGFGGNPFGGDDPLTCSANEARRAQPAEIRTPAARQLFQHRPRALFIDVRPASDYKRGHIPGALNIPIEAFEPRSAALSRRRTIVLYQGGEGSGEDACAFSRAAGRILLARGFSKLKVLVYKDGLRGWHQAGLPIQK